MKRRDDNRDRRTTGGGSRIRKILLSLFLLLIISAAGYWYLYQDAGTIAPTEGEIPTFTTVENPDSLAFSIVVVTDNDVEILSVSNVFYKDAVYWPYIFEANRAVIENPLNIPKGTLLKIPRIDSLLLDKEHSVEIAKALADSILSNVKN